MEIHLYINDKTSVIFDQSFQVEQKYIPLLWKLTFHQKVGMEEATKESNELRKDEMPILLSDNTITYCTKRKNKINYCVCRKKKKKKKKKNFCCVKKKKKKKKKKK